MGRGRVATVRKPRAEWLTDQKALQQKALEDAVAELQSSEGFARWLEVRSKFHRYSFNNQLLIAMQYPNASEVAGYRKWETLGRQVRRGEKSIRIFAPISRKVETESGEEKRQLVGFKLAPVFAYEQTEGEPLPHAPVAPVDGDSHAHYLDSLERYAGTLGYVVETEDTGSANGYCDATGKRIVLGEHLAPNHKVKTLIHEIAHAHGISYTNYERLEAEVIVESVAWTVANTIGLDTGPYSFGYVATWGGDDAVERIRGFAETIHKIAAEIETALV